MTTEEWVVAGIIVLSLWGIGVALDRVNANLKTLIDLVHRIRVNDREHDF